ncbi:MAG: killer suppression protein [Deltaproteobacteria bacterium]|nr:killer suppression protein [Deltaproteobacteria bacterium]
MKIYFKTKKLKKVCSSQKEMLKTCGSKRARKLQQRLMELQAAETLEQISYLPPLRCHELSGDMASWFSVDLDHPYRLLFIPVSNPVPKIEEGGIDRSKVTEIEIIEISNTHE